MPTTNPPRYDLDRQFALELQGINADRAAAGKPPLDSARQAELRSQIESELKTFSNSQDESQRGAVEAGGSALRDFAGAAVTGAADPLVKIATNINGGRVPKLLQPVKDWAPENPDSAAAGVKGIAGLLTENALMGGAGKLLRGVPGIGKILSSASASTKAPVRMAATGAESAVLPAALTGAEGGSAEEMKTAAKVGGVAGAGFSGVASLLKKPLERAALAKYRFDPTNPAQEEAADLVLKTMTGETDAIPSMLRSPKDWAMTLPDRTRNRLLGKAPERVLADVEAQAAANKSAKDIALQENANPIPASQIDDITTRALDENFSIPNAKPVSKGGPSYSTKRPKSGQKDFSRIGADLDQSIMPLFGRKATPGPFSVDPLQKALDIAKASGDTAKAAKIEARMAGRTPRENMLLSPTSVSDLSQEARYLRNQQIPKQKTNKPAPTHASMMENTPAYRAGEQLRKGLTEALGNSADTPEGKAIIEAAFKTYSTTREAQGIAGTAVAGNKTSDFYKNAVAGSAAAGGVVAARAGNMTNAAKLFAFAAATGATRPTALLTRNALTTLAKPKNASTIPMLLRRMSPTTTQDEEQP